MTEKTLIGVITKKDYKFVIIGVILLLAGLFTGWIYGSSQALTKCVEIGLKIVDINIKPEVAEQLIHRYGTSIENYIQNT